MSKYSDVVLKKMSSRQIRIMTLIFMQKNSKLKLEMLDNTSK